MEKYKLQVTHKWMRWEKKNNIIDVVVDMGGE